MYGIVKQNSSCEKFIYLTVKITAIKGFLFSVFYKAYNYLILEDLK